VSYSELLEKYDVPGPRYTSYPSVPHWTRAPSSEEWLTHLAQAVERGKKANEGASLYVHIPFCRSLCHYCGCNTFISRDPSVSDPYVDDLLKEWGLYVSRLGTLRLDEVHLGGGTPTYLSAEQLDRLLTGLFAAARVPDEAELSIEVDPRVTTPAQLAVLARLGFTRISLGIQDFDPKVQASVNREQTVDQVRAVTEQARSLGFDSVNFDLIYGLPHQTPKSITETMAAVMQLAPDRIAFYGYAHVPWMKPAMRRFQDADVPAGPQKRKLYEVGRAELAHAGYREIGMDHFGREGDALLAAADGQTLHRNFMGYTVRRTMPMLGLGVSSIGDTWTAFAQNEKTVPAWRERVLRGELPITRGHVLDTEDLVLRRHILDVMTRFEADWSVETTPFLDEAPSRLEEMARAGLVELRPTGVKVTPEGRPFVRNVCMALDGRLARQAAGPKMFSRTV
jgi:oxygen-independent coproporphyrinogen-3 oxidase